MGKNVTAGNKARQILNIIFACIAVGSAVTAFLLTPFGKRLTGKAETSPSQTVTSATQSVTQSFTETPAQSGGDSSTAAPVTDSTVSAQTSTPTAGLYKDYTFFIDKSKFDYTCENGITSLTAKGNADVKMTVKQFADVSYTKLCTDTEKSYSKLADSEKLEIENPNTCYRSQTGDKQTDIITTVYCIDDNKGGSIEVKYQYPVGAEAYKTDFDILLSMFKVFN